MELVTDYLDGTLERALEFQVVVHLGRCEGCVVYVVQLHSTVDRLRSLSRRPEDWRYRARLMVAFREAFGPPAGRSPE